MLRALRLATFALLSLAGLASVCLGIAAISGGILENFTLSYSIDRIARWQPNDQRIRVADAAPDLAQAFEVNSEGDEDDEQGVFVPIRSETNPNGPVSLLLFASDGVTLAEIKKAPDLIHLKGQIYSQPVFGFPENAKRVPGLTYSPHVSILWMDHEATPGYPTADISLGVALLALGIALLLKFLIQPLRSPRLRRTKS